jgi:hypothetical protein
LSAHAVRHGIAAAVPTEMGISVNGGARGFDPADPESRMVLPAWMAAALKRPA